MDNIFETLMNGGNLKLAIRYAKWIIKNGEGKTPAEIAPGTKVNELVEELAKYLPEKQKELFCLHQGNPIFYQQRCLDELQEHQ